MKGLHEIEGVEYDICETQQIIFRTYALKGYDMEIFTKEYLTSDFAADIWTGHIRDFNWKMLENVRIFSSGNRRKAEKYEMVKYLTLILLNGWDLHTGSFSSKQVLKVRNW